MFLFLNIYNRRLFFYVHSTFPCIKTLPKLQHGNLHFRLFFTFFQINDFVFVILLILFSFFSSAKIAWCPWSPSDSRRPRRWTSENLSRTSSWSTTARRPASTRMPYPTSWTWDRSVQTKQLKILSTGFRKVALWVHCLFEIYNWSKLYKFTKLKR